MQEEQTLGQHSCGLVAKRVQLKLLSFKFFGIIYKAIGMQVS